MSHEDFNISSFLANLNSELFTFKAESIKLLEFASQNEYSIACYRTLARYNPLRLDIEHSLFVINTSISQNTPFKYDSFNGLILKKSGLETPLGQNQEKINDEYKIVLERSISDFFNEENRLINYNELSLFSCYKDEVVSTLDRIKFLKSRRNSVYNLLGWENFFNKSFQKNYSEYDIYIEDKTNFQCLKVLCDNILYCIEYNKSNLSSDLKIGNLSSPDVNIILLFKNNTDDTVSKKIILSKLQHPFFDGLIQLKNYVSMKNIIRLDNNTYEVINETKEQKTDDNFLRFYNDSEAGESFLKFAFYEQVINSYFNRQYLSYIEKAVLNILQ